MMNRKRKAPVARQNPVKKPRASDIKTAANSLLMLAQTSTDCRMTEEETSIAETLLLLGASDVSVGTNSEEVNQEDSINEISQIEQSVISSTQVPSKQCCHILSMNLLILLIYIFRPILSLFICLHIKTTC